ncbi:MAG: hypothetical protein ACQESB_04995 [Elusimicrobiota bacterium]
MKEFKCSICGATGSKDEMVYTRFRKPACPMCFYIEKGSACVVLKLSRKKGARCRVFSPFFNYWKTNDVSYPEPVKSVVGDFNYHGAVNFYRGGKGDECMLSNLSYEWKWILKRNYKAAARGCVSVSEEFEGNDFHSQARDLCRDAYNPFEIFILFRYFHAEKRILYEVIVEKDFIEPAVKWCIDNEELIVRELSCLLK